jgi:hypothetical protein
MEAGQHVVSAAFITPYPPGFLVLVPGQVFSRCGKSMARSGVLVCPSVFSRNREFKSPRARTDGLWILRKAR